MKYVCNRVATGGARSLQICHSMTEQKTELAQVAPDRSDAMKSNHMCVNVKGSPLAVPELYEHVFYDRTEN